MKAFLRWAGSKKQLLPTLEDYWNGNGTYYEPFAGSSCLFFHLEPSSAVLGDINSELIDTLRAVRNQSSGVVSELENLRPGKRHYDLLRKTDPADLSARARAARFIHLNRNCFNGLYRTNASGQFNVPFGRHKTKRRFDTDLLLQASKLLRNATLVNDDFEKTVSSAKAGDLVYLDPPYFTSTKRVFAEYGPKTFNQTDLERLRRCVARLHKRKVRFVLSYLYDKDSRSLFGNWFTRRIRIRRNIAGFAGARKGSYELLVTNVDCEGTLISV